MPNTSAIPMYLPNKIGSKTSDAFAFPSKNFEAFLLLSFHNHTKFHHFVWFLY